MKYILPLTIFLSLLACQNDDDNKPNPTETALGLVTGVNLLPETGPSPITLGNPNIYIDKNIVSIYPNPVVNILSIRSTAIITDVWVIPAEPQKIYQEIDFETVLNSNIYTETEIANASSLTIENHTGTSAHLNFENLDPGYYRVFVKINNTLMWDNILFIDDGEIQDVFDYWE